MSIAFDTDVLIVGGGLFGCATAYFTSGFGSDTIVVDRGDIGSEASAANSGNLHLQLSPATHRGDHGGWMDDYAQQLPFFRAAHELWRSLASELGRDIELKITGGIMVAETKAQLQAIREKCALERRSGLSVDLVSAGELAALAPYLGPGFLGAAFCGAEGMANPLTALIAFADGAKARGARMLPQTAVRRITENTTGWEAHTDRGLIRCKNLVIAAGCWSDAISASLGVVLPITNRPIHVSVTEPSAHFISHLCYHTDLRLTLKQVANGNVVIGGGWSAAMDGRRDRAVVLRESLAQSLWVARRVVPGVGGLSLIRSWAGRNVYTPDSRPILGPVPGRRGLHLAVCNTYGFTLGPLCALLVAELVAGRNCSFDPAAFSIARFADLAKM